MDRIYFQSREEVISLVRATFCPRIVTKLTPVDGSEQRKFSLKPVSSMPLVDYFWSVWRRKHEQSGGTAYRLPARPEAYEKRLEGIGTEETASDATSTSKCYVFEFTSPHLHVISIARPQRPPTFDRAEELAKEENITLVAVRDLYTLDQLPRREVEAAASAYGWGCVPYHRFDSFSQAG